MLTCRVLNTHIPTNRVCAILTRHFCPLGSLPCVPSSQADVRNEHHEGHSKPPPPTWMKCKLELHSQGQSPAAPFHPDSFWIQSPKAQGGC